MVIRIKILTHSMGSSANLSSQVISFIPILLYQKINHKYHYQTTIQFRYKVHIKILMVTSIYLIQLLEDLPQPLILILFGLEFLLIRIKEREKILIQIKEKAMVMKMDKMEMGMIQIIF